MESAASKENRELLRQQSIQRQIAQLQAQLLDPNAPLPSPVHASSLEETKRKRPDVTVLAPTSPQSKKRKLAPVVPPRKPGGRGTDEHRNLCESNASDRGAVLPPQPGPSNVLSKLSALSKHVPSPAEPDAPIRTSSFADKASGAPARDDRLMLMEELEPGPYEHKPPLDDPAFGRLEPHSCIRLTSRQLPYEDLQAYMTGRYYISPSKLYSVVRAQPGGAAGARGQAYDVPVVGDWVTIAVVAGRSPVRISRAPVAVGPGEARDADDPDPTPTPSVTQNPKSAGRKDPEPPPRIGGRKYVNMTLIDFGAGGGGGKKGTSRGDAVLSLLLFESDTYDTVSRGDGLLPEKIYKGGSRGAFESMAKLREGSVIALLNPRVLKPLQKPGAPNILALTPESATSVAIIGTARDLGMCGVVKRDGKPCGSWFDKRVSDVCEYHVQHAVQRCRAGRSEFSMGTSGMGVGSGSQKRKADYDPQRKWGLQPANGSVGSPSSSQLEGGEGPTYVVAGHIVAGGAAGKHDMFLKEKVGREAQARAARRTNSRDTDVALKRLLARDKEGMKAVQEARKFAMKAKGREKQQITNGKEVEKEEEAGTGDDSDSESSGNDDEGDDALADRPRSRTTKTTTTKNAYSARVIKELGFDPTVKSLRGDHGRRREEGDEEEPEASRNEIYSKLRELASCRQLDRIRLGPRPGGRVRSVVSAPKGKFKLSAGPDPEGHGGMVDLDEISNGDEERRS